MHRTCNLGFKSLLYQLSYRPSRAECSPRRSRLDSPAGPHRLAVKVTALSRLQRGFESRWGHACSLTIASPCGGHSCRVVRGDPSMDQCAYRFRRESALRSLTGANAPPKTQKLASRLRLERGRRHGLVRCDPGHSVRSGPSNPPVTQEPKWDSARTRQLAADSCFDCHSNLTKWRWYSNVAPMSWLVQSDVDGGRAALNFSEWDKPQDAGVDHNGGDSQRLDAAVVLSAPPSEPETRPSGEGRAHEAEHDLAQSPPIGGG